MKQTAVEFFHSEYKRIFGDVFVDVQKVIEISDSLEKAKDIEKTQIKKAHSDHCTFFSCENKDRENCSCGENYFKKHYEK